MIRSPAILGLALSLLLPPALAVAETPAATALDQRAAIAQLLEQPDSLFPDGRAPDFSALQQFYRARDFAPVWADHDERVAQLGIALAAALEDGIDLALPSPERGKGNGPAAAFERDLLLTDTALRLATVLAMGRVQPQQWEEDWAVPAPSFDAAAGLERALGSNRLVAWLTGLAPTHDRYLRLKGALAHYRVLARDGGWRQVPGGPSLKPGMSDPRVPAIRRRLVAGGDLPLDAAGEDTYDGALEAGIRAFQLRHGIVPDGVVGARTVAAMNVPVRARIEQIALNLERWRALPRDLGKDYLFVNVPGETLEVFAGGAPVLAMKVVVGDPLHPTPVVQSRIAAITFNPSWRVPLSIGRNEILPKVKADPHYLEKNQMVMKGAYVFEQLPGPKNPLGQIKFETPNKFDVYLHDTSTHASFERVARALSHGCVRTEDARGLAAYVLDGAKWPDEEIQKAIDAGVTQKVDVMRHLRVNLFYLTSFVDPDGTVEFRDDLYGRDKRLRAALQGAAPPATIANAKPKPGVI